jgi:hypothetical protein
VKWEDRGMKSLRAWAMGALALVVSNDGRSAPPRQIYSFLLPTWQETRSHPAPLARVRENDEGFTQIDFRWPVTLNTINSRLQQQVWEDGEAYVVFNMRGKRIFCACEADSSPKVAFRRTAASDIYYFVDNQERVLRPVKYGQVKYGYTFFSMSRNGLHYYQCVFAERLPSIVPRKLLHQAVPEGNVNEIPALIAGYLATNGADIARDECEEIEFKL